MGLTSNWTLVVFFALGIGAVAATVVLWNRVRGPQWARWPARGSLIVACQVTACLAVAAIVNDAGQFYTSWRELFGATAGISTRHLQGGAEDRRVAGELRREGRVGKSLVASVLIPDAGDSNAQRALVYLPAEYFSGSYKDATFPVIELLDGFPGGPHSWTLALHIQRIADREIETHRALPFIAVMPAQNYLGQHDAECINAVGGAQVETTLTTNVRNVIEHDFRANHESRAWSVMGYSTGGFCATNIAMRHPDMFGSAISLSGYDKPYLDGTTGELFGHSAAAEHANDPLWRAQHLPGPPISLLLASTRQDHGAYTDALELSGALRAPTHGYLLTLPTGGHNAGAFRAMEPAALDWVSRILPPPLSLSVAVADQQPVPVVPVTAAKQPARHTHTHHHKRPTQRLKAARPKFQ